MAFPHIPLDYSWPTSLPRLKPTSSSPTKGLHITTLFILVFGLILAYFFLQNIMDLVDAYMELPSFTDIPLIIRDQFRGIAQRGTRMQRSLTLRPFATDNVFTWRDKDISPFSTRNTSSFWGNSTGPEIFGSRNGMYLSDRFKNRTWSLEEAESESSQASNFPGLVNTGNFCFMNSVLQAFASLPEFQTYLETIDKGTEATPVASSLADLLQRLNTPLKYATALQPDQVARALMQSDKNRLLATREQQDAQEFFSLLLDTLESESTRQWLIENKLPGLETLTTTPPSNSSVDPQISLEKSISTLNPLIPNPFEGLSANRMGCLKCKYVENIRHEKFGPMVLPLTVSGSTTLMESLQNAFEIEILDDVECQKCTLLAYRANLLRLIDKLPPGITATMEATHRREKIDLALRSGKLDDASLLGGDVKKFIQRSQKTKHYMIARPPRLLAFHIQRSNFINYTGRALKNQASVGFPRMLDVSEYVTTSELSMDPEEPISRWKPGDARTLYRLRSVIVHYGLHHIGHYVAYRCVGDKWFRISDEDVEAVTIEDVLRDGARGVFMLMYELVSAVGNGKAHVRDVSPVPKVETIETIPESFDATISTEKPEISDSEEESQTLTERPSLQLDSLHPVERMGNGSLLDVVGAKLNNVHISPASSVVSHSTDDFLADLEQKSTRSTSFSSVHSRPRTPIFEARDPQMSPPPFKKARKDVAEEEQNIVLSNTSQD